MWCYSVLAYFPPSLDRLKRHENQNSGERMPDGPQGSL